MSPVFVKFVAKCDPDDALATVREWIALHAKSTVYDRCRIEAGKAFVEIGFTDVRDETRFRLMIASAI